MKKVVFSGIQPSGELHIGNYLGAILNWLTLQEKYRCIFCVVDLHTITVRQNPKVLKEKIREVANIYLASGIDPKKSIIFVQSHRPEHAELAWILSTLARFGELRRMTQFKEKAKKHPQNVNAGLFNYPVLMAADILLYQTDWVPVGEDQIQHVEITRTIARRFNNTFGPVFKVPKVLIRKEVARIMALDNPKEKMSKSAKSIFNYIALADPPNLIREKIKKATTDSGKEIIYNPNKKPAISNLLTIYSAFSGLSFKEIENKYKNKGYAEFKKDLAEVVIRGLAPFQKKLSQLQKNPKYTDKVLIEGAKKAQKIAQKTLREVKEKIGLG